MARQSTKPVEFNRSTRVDNYSIMTSGRAGKVYPLTYIPLLRGDSASGTVTMNVELAEMPRPLQNGVSMNVQAWFVPKTCHPQFFGKEEFMHSYLNEEINTAAGTRTPPEFFNVVETGPDIATIDQSEFFKTLGIHIPAGEKINTDLIDAFWLIYNFRLAAHSSRLQRAEYSFENLSNSVSLPRAFWPSGRWSRIVPDYERALVIGEMDLDITAGQLPVTGLFVEGGTEIETGAHEINADGLREPFEVEKGRKALFTGVTDLDPFTMNRIFAEMAGQQIITSLADIEKARTTQAFAKLRTAYAGNDTTGYDNDDVIIAHLMQGFAVPDEAFKRPWLLDSKRVAVGFAERHATDGASLDQSVTLGQASASLRLNVPTQDAGGLIIVTMELLPERLDERQSDEWLHVVNPSQFPDALRDIQRPEPVDLVISRRIDAKHSTPNALYGFEPMNDVWNRTGVRLGGAYYQADPNNPWTEQRSAIWQTAMIDPEFSDDHFLAPANFPHIVFSDTTADAWEANVRHNVSIVGLTQIGDVLYENNDDYENVKNTQIEDAVQ